VKRWSLSIAAVLIVIPLVFITWVVTSDSGTQWLFNRSLPLLPEQLKITTISGRLLGPVKIQGLHYRTDAFKLDIDGIELDWKPSSLFQGTFHIKELRLINSRLSLADNSRGARAAVPMISLPVAIILDSATADSIQVSSPGKPSVEFTGTALQLSANRKVITIHSFSTTSEQRHLQLSGIVHPRDRLPLELTVSYRQTLGMDRIVSSQGKVYGDLHKLQLQQTLTGPVAGQFKATLTNLLTDLHWQVQVETPAVQLSTLAPSWPDIEAGLKATASGDQQDYTFELSSRFSAAKIRSGRLDMSGNGNLRRLNLDHITVTLPGGRIDGHAELQRNTDLDWTLALGSRDFDLGTVFPERAERVTFTSAALGRITLANAATASSGSKNNKAPPLYTFELKTDASTTHMPSTHLQLAGSGDLDRLRLKTLSLTLPQGGHVKGNAELHRNKGLSWKLSLAGKDINPGLFQPDWTGQLGFSATSTGKFRDKRVDAQVDIDDAGGKLRGYPLALQASLAIQSSQLNINRLQLDSGHSHILVNGLAGRQLKLDWEIHSPDLQELHPQARGQLQASGHITGSIDQPGIRFTAQGQDLGWRDYRLDSLAGNGTLDLFSWQTLQLEIQAQGLALPSQHLDNLEIKLAGSGSRHHLDLIAVDDTNRIAVQLDGHYHDTQWQGQLLEATLTSAHYDEWQLESTVDLQFTATRVDSQPLCWKSARGRLCLDLERRQRHWIATLNAEELSLAPIAVFLPDNLHLQGLLSGKASIDYQTDAAIRARAELLFSSGKLSYPLIEGEHDTWNFDRGQMDLRLDEAGLAMSMSVDVNGDHWQLATSLPGLDPLSFTAEKQALRGDAHIDISDLGLIEAFIPEIQGLQGTLVSALKISGTLAQPEISGQAQLQRGRFRIPRFGLHLEDLDLSIRTRDLNRFSYQVSVKSNQGQLQMNGDTEFRSPDDWSGTLTLRGKDFEVINIPEARITASPDLQVAIKPYTVQIDGDIHIPRAKLQPKDLSQATPISNDVSIKRAGVTEPEKKWQINSHIRLTLGERVSWYGFGFEGRFSGKLLLVDQPDQPTLATGELTIQDGRYEAYGQRLTIEQGHILYSGGPLNNPGLNLRAARYIGEVTAGVRVNGTLQAPHAELYSVPAMGQTDTLAYLILGRPVEQASGNDGAMMANAALALSLSGGDLLARKIGDRFDLDEMRIASSDTGDQAELIIGHYIDPRLYLSYSVGLIESVNTVIIRYQLSRNWQFKAESGIEQGADLLYVIER